MAQLLPDATMGIKGDLVHFDGCVCTRHKDQNRSGKSATVVQKTLEENIKNESSAEELEKTYNKFKALVLGEVRHHKQIVQDAIEAILKSKEDLARIQDLMGKVRVNLEDLEEEEVSEAIEEEEEVSEEEEEKEEERNSKKRKRNSEEPSPHCDLCNTHLSTKQALQQHNNAFHKEPNTCKECGKNIAGSLKKHNDGHPRKTRCTFPECGSVLSNWSTWETHYRNNHFDCNLCHQSMHKMQRDIHWEEAHNTTHPKKYYMRKLHPCVQE